MDLRYLQGLLKLSLKLKGKLKEIEGRFDIEEIQNNKV